MKRKFTFVELVAVIIITAVFTSVFLNWVHDNGIAIRLPYVGLIK